MSSAPITRTHRLAVARAWEGQHIPTLITVNRWLGTGLIVDDESAQLERLAQLVADAEGKLSRVQDYCGRIYGHTGGDECADCLFSKPPEQP